MEHTDEPAKTESSVEASELGTIMMTLLVVLVQYGPGRSPLSEHTVMLE